VDRVIPAAAVDVRSDAPVHSVPLRALTLSLIALAGALVVSLMWPDVLLDQQVAASVLALIPAFLLAHYRRWAAVSVLLGVGMGTLGVLHLLRFFLGVPFGTFPLVLILVAPYVAIALGAGWFGEIRRSTANLRATQLQLIQAEKLESIGRLAAGVAHEVKNPLMTILTGIKVLSRQMREADEPTRRLLQDMVDAVNRADTIIGGLLSYSRQHELELAPVDINATIERTLRLIKHELDTKRIAVVKELNPSLPPVALDAPKVQQVFINLFTNAVQAMGEEGVLTLRTFPTTIVRTKGAAHRETEPFKPGESAVVIQVDDTGPGIAANHLGKVFDPFFTTKPNGVGTGLGLSVARQILDMHGATIDIANGDVAGARVTIMFKPAQTERQK
jgi:signal transduction histidine kinase